MWNNSKTYPEKDFSTPPRNWKSAPCSPMLSTEKKRSSPSVKLDSFHVIHKVPAGDSPYVKAKHVQLIDRDPNKAISLFWSAINSGDRVDSALKDMAIVMKQLNRADEAIEAIKSFRHLCPLQTQESLDNILIDLYKRCGRFGEQIELLQHKLKLVEEGTAFGGKRTKMARSQGKKFQVSIEQEASRLLGNLAWAYMQQDNYQTAEELYRKALSIEADKNKQCNLSICLMKRGKITEAKTLLQAIRPSPKDRQLADPYIKSFDRASEILAELESQSICNPIEQTQEKRDSQRSFLSAIYENSKLALFINEDQNQDFGFSVCRKWEDGNNKELVLKEMNSDSSMEEHKRRVYSHNLFENETSLGFEKRRWCSETEVETYACKSTSTKEETYTSQFSIDGNSELMPLESRIDQQSPQQPLFVDKWNKGDYSRKTMDRIPDFSSSHKGRCISEMGIEECFASKNMNTNGNIFGSPISINGNLKPTGIEETSCSQYSIEGDWRRSWGACVDKCNAETERSSNLKIMIQPPTTIENVYAQSKHAEKKNSSSPNTLTESSTPCDNPRSMAPEMLGSGLIESFADKDRDQKSRIVVLGGARWQDIVTDKDIIRRKNNHEAEKLPASIAGNPKPPKGCSIFKGEKSWADMVEEEEEEEEEFSTLRTDFPTNGQAYMSQDSSSVSLRTPNKRVNGWNDGEDFHDENLNSNIISSTPSHPPTATRSLLRSPSQTYPFIQNHHAEILCRNLEAVDLKDGCTGSASLSFRNSTARRSLSFERQQKQDPEDYYCFAASPKKAFAFENYNAVPENGSESTCGRNSRQMRRRNRLQVFRDITLLPDSPRT